MARNISNQLRKQVMANINQIAQETNRNLNKIIGDELLQTYKENVIESYLENDTTEYGERSIKAVKAKEETETAKAYAKKVGSRAKNQYTYKHSGKFVDSIGVTTEDR